MGTSSDIAGQRFGRLVALRPVRSQGHKSARLCACLCGQLVWVRTDKLARRKSCGCEQREARAAAALAPKAVPAPRLVLNPEQRALRRLWRSMKTRCRLAASGRGTTKQNLYYAHVSVCERWRTSFESFLADMGPRPSPRHSLDRYPDNNGNYEPGNVRWATAKEQNNNRRPARPPRARKLFKVGERLMSYADIASETGLRAATIESRLRNGWSVERILATPQLVPGGRPYHRRKTNEGVAA
jgi:hypothetical protein